MSICEMFATADLSGIMMPLYSASTGRPGLEWCWGNVLQWIGSTACGGSRTLSRKFGHWGEKVGGEKNRWIIDMHSMVQAKTYRR